MKYSAIIFLVTLLTSLTSVLAAKQTQIIDMRLTPLGDADVKVQMKFDAQAWQMWKQTIGENPSIMKREIERMFSTLILVDFDMKRNDIEREATVTFHATGAARYLGDGKWETDVEIDDADGGSSSSRKINDTTFLTTSSMSDGNLTAQQEITLIIPEGATDLMESSSEMGAPLLRYKLEPVAPSGGRRSLFFALGGVCLIGGVVSLVVGRFFAGVTKGALM